MSNLLRSAILVIITSVSMMFLGFLFLQTHPEIRFFAALGVADQNYLIASWSILAGGLGFFGGLALLIGGLVRSENSN
jgi:hypothetical protein